MAEAVNLGVDFNAADSDTQAAAIARVAVVDMFSHSRDGSAPIISIDCTSYAMFQGEIERLHAELDKALAQARDFFGASQREPDGNRASARQRSAGDRAATTQKPRLASKLTVGDAMTRDVKTLRPNDPLSLAERLMQQTKIRHVIVTDEHRELMGLISRRDILFNRLARFTGYGKRAYDASLDTLAVKQVMQTDVTSVTADTELSAAGALMREQKIGCLPVRSGQEVVGILTTDDFLTLLAPA